MSEHPTDSPAVERMLPLYEGKMIHHYDARWATYTEDGKPRDMTDDEKSDRTLQPLPRYWVRESVVMDRLLKEDDARVPDWLLGYRRIARNTDERTIISSLMPLSGVGDNIFLILTPINEAILSAILCSYVMDYIGRQKIAGTNLNFFLMNQLPILPPETFERAAPWDPNIVLGDWVTERVDFLMEGPWDLAQRAETRAELDALMFYLYGMGEEDIAYIMNTFPIVKGKDEEKYGEYRTERLILEKYRALFMG